MQKYTKQRGGVTLTNEPNTVAQMAPVHRFAQFPIPLHGMAAWRLFNLINAIRSQIKLSIKGLNVYRDNHMKRWRSF